MPRIINEYRVEKHRVCEHCGRTVAYVKNEIQRRDGRDISGGPDGEEYVVCPGCGKRMILRSW